MKSCVCYRLSLLLLPVLLPVFVAQTGAGLKHNICDQDKLVADIKSVKVSDCDNDAGRCIFVKNTNKTIELVFAPKQKVNAVKVKIVGRIGAADLPFFIKPEDACSHYGFDCPLDAGQDYTFKLSLPVLSSYPRINVDVFLRLLTDDKSVIGCVEIPSKIQ